jgi:Integral membrane protein EMC3/TMCO1-like
MVFSLMPLGICAYSIATVLTSEIVMWLFIYRTPGFKALQANLAKQSTKLEAAKDGQSSKGLKKREARMEKSKEEAGRFMISMNFKTSVIVSPPPDAAGHHSDSAARHCAM